MKEILYVTLARGGSRGVPGKHIRLLGGKTVLEWTIDEVQKCEHRGDYAISSDDKEGILMIARCCGVTIINRPPELALDTTPTLPALQHAVEVMEHITEKRYAYIVEVRATSPFKTADDIDAAVELLMLTGADSVIGVTPLDDHHPARIKWLDENGYIRDFVPEPESGRRQDCLPKAYIRNGTIYALTRDAVMKQGKIFGHAKSIGLVMPPERSINIDTEMDWMLCQAIAEK